MSANSLWIDGSRSGQQIDSTHPPEMVWVREGIVERAIEDAFVRQLDDCAQLASCLGPQGMECDLKQVADVIVAVTEVCVIAHIEPIEVPA